MSCEWLRDCEDLNKVISQCGEAKFGKVSYLINLNFLQLK
jgi:hypothetical protein